MQPSTKSSTPLALSKTAKNDLLVKAVNTLFNPLARENILTPVNADAGTRAVYHAGGLALGYGGLAFLLRKLILAEQEKDRVKDFDKLVNYTKARYPTMSVDKNVRDLGAETRIEEQAVKKLKDIHGLAETSPELEDPTIKEAAATVPTPAEIAIREMEGPQSTTHFALAATAAILGGTGGWQVAEYIHDRNRRAQMERRVGKTKNLIDKLTYKEYLRTRGLKDPAARVQVPEDVPEDDVEKVAASPAEKIREQMGVSKSRYAPASSASNRPGVGGVIASGLNPAHAMKGLESMYWVWAAAAFALTYKAAKVYADKHDPNRKRMADIKRIAEERAKVTEAPVLMDESSLEDLEPPPRPQRVTPKPVHTVQPVGTAEAPRTSLDAPVYSKATVPSQRKTPLTVDSGDPYANLLQQ